MNQSPNQSSSFTAKLLFSCHGVLNLRSINENYLTENGRLNFELNCQYYELESLKTEVLHTIKKSNDILSQLGGLNIFKVKKQLAD